MKLVKLYRKKRNAIHSLLGSKRSETSELPPAIMVQGTSSNAGKSLIATALCRILTRAGLRVAPFKAQNMSLNSAATRDGGEIGRAQALQAEACGLEADVRMNPVLLKPLADTGSQLILLGKAAGFIHSRDYLKRRNDLWQTVLEAYKSISQDRDVMILEGAGSPAEVNLRSHDIVNMRMARAAQARVILTCDIDRGGAFAAIAGTMQLLRPKERRLIAGFLLNKFRGDPSLLASAVSQVQKLTKRPFLGIVPWMNDLNLPDEDSVSFGEKADLALSLAPPASGEKILDIVLPALPHISNTTDLDALISEGDVRVRIISQPEQFGNPACVILPGTRNTAHDLSFLRQHRLDVPLLAYAKRCLSSGKGMLVGICGGLQMLGKTVWDPAGLEGAPQTPGLCLLPLSSTLSPSKIVRRVRAVTTDALPYPGLQVEGYEIHHGDCRLESPPPSLVLKTENGEPLGYGRKDSEGTVRILGTYLHGLFDSDTFRHAFLGRLRTDFGLPHRPAGCYTRALALNRLADTIEKALPLERLLALVRRTVSNHSSRQSMLSSIL